MDGFGEHPKDVENTRSQHHKPLSACTFSLTIRGERAVSFYYAVGNPN